MPGVNIWGTKTSERAFVSSKGDSQRGPDRTPPCRRCGTLVAREGAPCGPAVAGKGLESPARHQTQQAHSSPPDVYR